MRRKNFEKHDRARSGPVTLFTLFIKYFCHLHKISPTASSRKNTNDHSVCKIRIICEPDAATVTMKF